MCRFYIVQLHNSKCTNTHAYYFMEINQSELSRVIPYTSNYRKAYTHMLPLNVQTVTLWREWRGKGHRVHTYDSIKQHRYALYKV